MGQCCHSGIFLCDKH